MRLFCHVLQIPCATQNKVDLYGKSSPVSGEGWPSGGRQGLQQDLAFANRIFETRAGETSFLRRRLSRLVLSAQQINLIPASTNPLNKNADVIDIAFFECSRRRSK